MKMIGINLLFLFITWTNIMGQSATLPTKYWQKYADITQAGFAKAPLDSLNQLLKNSNTDALLVIYDGKILLEYGKTDRRLPQASIRKTYLSALFGKYNIDLNKTLEQLNMEESTPLTDAEKQAKIIDLLTARSGIYLPSAYSPEGMEKNLPKRGSHAPGTFWFYNNWDFNVLGAIFKKETGKDLFNAFETDIAKPLQMEDFRLSDTYYRYEKDKSLHPAYLFKLSARDMARFGLLYLNKGKWNKKQIIPADWIERSTGIYTPDLGEGWRDRGAYGFLWWIAQKPMPTPMYYASGLGGQRLFILPQSKLVIVHLTDTYQNKSVSDAHLNKIVQLLLQAQSGKPIKKPKLIAPTTLAKDLHKVVLADASLENYIGTYKHRFLGEFKITMAKEYQGLWMETGIGVFRLFPTGMNSFWAEDIDFPCEFIKGDAEKKGQAASEVNDKREMQKVLFYY